MGLSLRGMAHDLPKVESVLRISAALILVLTACLIGSVSQTKVILFITKTVTFRDLQALKAAIYIDSMSAAYNLLQLGYVWFKAKPKASNPGYRAWLCCLLDQIAVYMVFAGNTAAFEHSFLALTGSKELQWSKWCDKFTRFCFEIGGALVSGYVAAILMALISSISAFNLFRFYSPKRFLLLKSS